MPATKQTEASKEAISRDGELCLWCLIREKKVRHVFAYVEGYNPMYSGTHHILKRSRVDDARAIITLCSQHHSDTENKNRPSKDDLADLMLEVYGYNLRELWPQYFKNWS